MSYRDILVQIDETPASRDRATAVAHLARRSGAELTGVFLKSDFLRNYMVGGSAGYLAPETIDLLIRDHASGVEKASEAARAIFESAAGEAGLESDWQVIEGDDADGLSALARRFDLTALPPVATASMGWRRITAPDVGLACGGPVLVLPPTGPVASLGDNILVAWKGTRESARALHDAWPLIAKAREVHVLIVAPKGEGGPEGRLQRHFERHDCKANLIVDRSHDASAGEILRQQVMSLGADLVVMGLYGRPRVQEMILGGLSAELLGKPPVPLFVSH